MCEACEFKNFLIGEIKNYGKNISEYGYAWFDRGCMEYWLEDSLKKFLMMKEGNEIG